MARGEMGVLISLRAGAFPLQPARPVHAAAVVQCCRSWFD